MYRQNRFIQVKNEHKNNLGVEQQMWALHKKRQQKSDEFLGNILAASFNKKQFTMCVCVTRVRAEQQKVWFGKSWAFAAAHNLGHPVFCPLLVCRVFRVPIVLLLLFAAGKALRIKGCLQLD